MNDIQIYLLICIILSLTSFWSFKAGIRYACRKLDKREQQIIIDAQTLKKANDKVKIGMEEIIQTNIEQEQRCAKIAELSQALSSLISTILLYAKTHNLPTIELLDKLKEINAELEK